MVAGRAAGDAIPVALRWAGPPFQLADQERVAQ